MTTNKNRNGSGFHRKVLFLALLAAFGPAHAEDDSVAALVNPDTAVVSGGLGWVSGNSADRALFGQYNGWRTNDVNLLLDFAYIKRDDNGVWTRSFGRNLGLDVLDIGFAREKQGDWMYSLDYDQMVRREPNTINTGVQGVGSTAPIIGNTLAAPGTGSDYELAQKRKGLTFAVSKWIVPNLAFDASYKFEDKQGSRLFGVGGYCSNVISPVCTGANGTVGALYLTPEPIDSTTQQFEAKLTYSGATFSITAGYYGGFYSNGNSVMTPSFPNGGSTLTNTGDTLGPLAGLLSQPLALPPDNQSNQFYLSGNTSLPLNTRINFKAAYTHATQNAEYPSQLLVGASPALATLNGTLDTTVLQAGLTSRPMTNLVINGSLRWEDRQDKSDRNIYVVAPNGTQYTNNPTNSTFGNAKLEAGYQVTDVDRASLGVDYLNVERERPLSTTWIPDTSMAAMRESNNETGVYGEWRRSMSDTLNGALTYRYAKREGYHWYALDPALGFPFVRYDSFTPEAGTFPATMLDRTRQTIKLTGDWSPTDAFSLNFSLEDGKDSYDGPNNVDAGLNDTKVQFYNLDAVWRLSANWRMTGYASFGKQNLNMQQGIGYIAALEQTSTAVGLGIVGTIKAGFDVGGDVTYLDDKSSYDLSMTTGEPVSNLPDNSYRATILKLWGKYAIDKKSDVRVDLIQQWADYNDFTWGYNGVPFTYSDNSTVNMQPNQNVTFLGVRYIYRFR
jgi:MtrB/PioB family decaheme-associated outer membrane protein